MHCYETTASDAIERIARKLGIPIDLDDPEPLLIRAVERAVTRLLATHVKDDNIVGPCSGGRP